jgi:hypothetical protein
VLEQRDLQFTEGGTDRGETVVGEIQHAVATLGARLQAASAGDLQPSGSAELKVTAIGDDVASLIPLGTKTRAGHRWPHASGFHTEQLSEPLLWCPRLALD